MGSLILRIVIISLAFSSIILPFFYLRYIHRMKKEKCLCSQGFNRNFIQFYSVYNYLSIILLVILSMMISAKKVNAMLETPTRIVMTTGFAFLTAYALYNYQKNVYQDSCVCAVESWEPSVMKVHSYIIGLIFLIGILNIIALLAGETNIPNQIRRSIQNNIKNN